MGGLRRDAFWPARFLNLSGQGFGPAAGVLVTVLAVALAGGLRFSQTTSSPDVLDA
jgi:hypothetical protein